MPRDERVDVLKRRTDWFKVRTERGIEGWAAQQRHAEDACWPMARPSPSSLGDRAGFTSHRWEIGIFAGDYSGATLISAYGSFSFNAQLAAELSVGQFLGNASNGTVGRPRAHARVRARVAPLAVRRCSARASCTSSPRPRWCCRRTAPTRRPTWAAALRFYLTRRFFCAAEYKSHMVFTSRNDNEEIDEWKLGFAFFF